MEEKYNGWSNYPTWALDLYITNTESSYTFWNTLAKNAKYQYPIQTMIQFANEMKEFVEEELETSIEDLPGWIKDITRYAFEKINFYEIAETLLED